MLFFKKFQEFFKILLLLFYFLKIMNNNIIFLKGEKLSNIFKKGDKKMARKTLKDFNYDYQKYADYLESAECANDDGYDVYGDQYGNVYTPTEGDWTKGHGHKNENTNYDRPEDAKESYGRKWKNPWLKYASKLNLTLEEVQFLASENEDVKQLCKKR